jgi:hypothetical protein
MTSKPEDLLYQNLIRSGIVRITVAPKTGWEPSQFGIKTSVPALQRGFQESAGRVRLSCSTPRTRAPWRSRNGKYAI